MTWRKYFTPVKTDSNLSVISGNNSVSKPGPSRANYSSYLPDVYSGSPNRIDRYQQYEIMDGDPEVNAALDILAEFCTQKLKDGKSPFSVTWRYKATNSEVRILSEYLQQWNKLQQFDTRIFRVVRNTFKYGDSFFIRDPETQKWHWIDPSKIVKIIVNESDGKKPEQYVIKDLAPNFEDLVVTQITPNINPRQTGGGISASPGYFGTPGPQRGTSGPYPSASSGSRFGLSETEYAIDAKHVVHLSLSEGLDNNYPFGNSLLENIFKVYKQKELLEDAILIYRIQRAPERRVFHIDVGNMPSHMAMAFVERVKTEIHQRRIPSQSGGGCFAMNTQVPLCDGRVLTITELANEFKQGQENWIYSCNPETQQMVPGIVTWAGVTQKSAHVLELTLDNGEKIICTPEHKFPIIGKGSVEAKDIAINQDKLINFDIDNYKKLYGEHFQFIDTLNFNNTFLQQSSQVSKNFTANEKNTNRTVISIEHLDTPIEVGTLTIDGKEEFHNYHTFAIKQGVYTFNSNLIDSAYNPLSIGEDYFFPKTCLALTEKIKLLDNRSLSLLDIIQEFKQGQVNWVYTVNQLTHEIEPGKIVWAGVTRTNAQLVEVLLSNNQTVKTTLDHAFILRDGSEKLAKDLLPFESVMSLDMSGKFAGQHTVISVTVLDVTEDTGDITVESANDNHNFALEAGIFIHNSEGRGSDVTTLQGGQSLGEISDLQYFTNKLFRGLRIPSSYLPTGAEESQTAFNDGRVGTAYIQELRFNKYCERLQSLLTEVFDIEFKMYMYTRGLNIDSNLFELQFNPPMNFASSRQATIDAERINTFNTIQQIPFMSNRFAMKRFLGLTEEELAENERLWAEENGHGLPTYTDAAGELRSAGLSAAGIEGDLGIAGDLSAPEDLISTDEPSEGPAPGTVPASMPAMPSTNMSTPM